jgi:hypothetical protein
VTGFDSSPNVIPIFGILTGIVAILTPVAIVFIIFHFRHLRYVQRQQTIRMAIEKGLDLSPLLTAGDARPADLHPGDPYPYVLRGLLWGLPGIAIGLGVTWAAIQYGPRGLTIIGWIPAAIGAAYLIFSRFAASHNRDAERMKGFLSPPTHSGIPPADPRRTE